MPPRKRKPFRWTERNTEPRPDWCPSCEKPVLSGLYRGDPIHLDIPALTQSGEILALVGGGKTYLVCGHVYRRHAMAITDEPYPKLGRVHRLHVCGTPPPDGIVPDPPPYDPDAPPPF